MFSISITIGPSGRMLFEFIGSSLNCSRRPVSDALRTAKRLQTSLHSFFIERDAGAVLQFAADRAITSRNNFLAWLNAVFDFRVSVVGNSGCHFHHLRLASFFEEHDL